MPALMFRRTFPAGPNGAAPMQPAVPLRGTYGTAHEAVSPHSNGRRHRRPYSTQRHHRQKLLACPSTGTETAQQALQQVKPPTSFFDRVLQHLFSNGISLILSGQSSRPPQLTNLTIWCHRLPLHRHLVAYIHAIYFFLQIMVTSSSSISNACHSFRGWLHEHAMVSKQSVNLCWSYAN